MTSLQDLASIRNYISSTFHKNRGFLFFMLLLFSIRWSFADHYRVPTGSMIPTIEIGDHVYTNKMAYDLKLPFTNYVITEMGKPKRGDIIVFEYPQDPSINYVKRLIALPGDEVQIMNGFVIINGKLTLHSTENADELIEKLSKNNGSFEYYEQTGEKKHKVRRVPYALRSQQLSFVVPENQYFFMGDNRDESSDSRYWGFVPRGNLKGQVRNVTMSVDFDGFMPQVKLARFGKELL